MRFTLLLTLSLTLVGPLIAQESEQERAQKHKLLLRNLAEANLYVTNEHYQKARDKFNEILKEYPDNLEAHTGVMATYNNERKTNEALGYAEKTKAKTKADSLPSMTLTALTHVYKRDMKSADQILDQAIARFPQEAYLPHVYKAHLLLRQRDYAGAKKHLDAALVINPDYPETYYLAGEAYRGLNQTNKAIEAWNAYLERVPHEGTRYNWVIKILKQLGAR